MSESASRQERIDADAARWLAAIECGTADRHAFERWRSGNPAHALAFIRVSQVGRDLDSLRDAGLSDRLAPSAEVSAPPSRGRRKLLMLGVGGILAAGLGGLGWTVSATAHEAETAVGERRRVVVAEGIAIELNTDSHVRWRRSDESYDIDLLRGEVMLERQLRSAAACRLHCGRSQIDLAAGGRINARFAGHGVDLAVLAGEASLRNGQSPSTLHVPALRRAALASEAAPLLSTISPREAGAISAWQQGQLQFNGETLEHAVSEYNRYLSRPIEIADPSIRDLRLGGRFSATDPADFCKALGEIYGVSAQVEPDRIRLMRS